LSGRCHRIGRCETFFAFIFQSCRQPQVSSSTGIMTSSKPTSPIYYDHEAFETFQHKVAALSADLKPCTIDNVRRHLSESYNRIITARAYWPSTPPEMDIIVRIPRWLKAHEQTLRFWIRRRFFTSFANRASACPRFSPSMPHRQSKFRHHTPFTNLSMALPWI
jgi:hypothetical protein